jgi:hypothetical protein
MQLRALRLADHVNMRVFVQNHRDLIKIYNELISAEIQNVDADAKSMDMSEKNKIAMTETVDLIIQNLSSE